MKYILLIASVLTLSCSAFSGVARVWHLTSETATEKCAITVIKFTSGTYKVETNCYDL